MSNESLSLDDLTAIIKANFGDDFVIAQREYGDGSSEATLSVKGELRASWRGRLVTMPPQDGVTPRGPKEYYDVQLHPSATLPLLHPQGGPSEADMDELRTQMAKIIFGTSATRMDELPADIKAAMFIPVDRIMPMIRANTAAAVVRAVAGAKAADAAIWASDAMRDLKAERDSSVASLATARTELERFTAGGMLDCHAICDQRDEAIARAESAERQLADEVKMGDGLRQVIKDAKTDFARVDYPGAAHRCQQALDDFSAHRAAREAKTA